jgi:hypothetical protein
LEQLNPEVMAWRGARLAEATDAKGKLFGFERVRELLGTARTAAGVASAAQAFGQEDDISVISVTRAAVFEPALA